MPKVNIFDSEENLPSHFAPVKRVSIVKFLVAGGKLDCDALQKFVDKHCVQEGQPLVIGQMDKLKAWDDDLFNVDHLKQVYPSDRIGLFNMKTRDIYNKHTIADFLKELDPKHQNKLIPVKSRYKKHAKSMRRRQDDDAQVPTIHDSLQMDQLPQKQTYPVKVESPAPAEIPRLSSTSKQKSSKTREADDKKKQKNIYYAKDLTCPTQYRDKINELLPDFLLPLGPCDLFSHMPEHLRAENLMCYVGSDKTGTALHRDICGTMGHNLMSYGEEGAYAEWFFIKDEHRDKLLSTFHARHKNDEEDGLVERERMENRKSSFVESDRVWVGRLPLKKAGFVTKLALQRPGDLVIIPSMCYHQVRNVKTSVKIAWNRATAHTLQLALENQLPIYQSLARPEVYRCKAMVFHTLQKYRKQVGLLTNRSTRHNDTSKLMEECRILMRLLGKDVIYPEMIEDISQEGVDDNVPIEDDGLYTTVCDFCSADIFNRYYQCRSCDTNYDLCMNCYSQGRGCQHLDQLVMYQSSKSVQEYHEFYMKFLGHANLVLVMAGFEPFDNTIPAQSNNYSLATVCRRIEMYRRNNGILSNHLICGHCDAIFTLSELYSKYGLDPYAIFARKRCPKLPEDDNSNIVFTCMNCSNHCDRCLDIAVVQKDITEKVYYAAPRHDPRNWGGPADVGVYNTAHWPDRRNGPKDRMGAQAKWTENDRLGCVRGSMIAAIDPVVLKRSLAKKDSAKKLAQEIIDASKQWDKPVDDTNRDETLCLLSYIEQPKDFVSEGIMAATPKRQREDDTEPERHAKKAAIW
ncbi:hypothetical protein BJV82DRAFT_667445 [Fennellomyces sp. T-0311]|nr:hypothetical protein BJV82DRAFT_667445 [Fennellomyces sp. T-0311]